MTHTSIHLTEMREIPEVTVTLLNTDHPCDCVKLQTKSRTNGVSLFVPVGKGKALAEALREVLK